MGQTLAILRYLGMMYGYYPEDPDLAWECDALMDGYNDIIGKLYPPFFKKTEEEKEAMYPEIFDKILPKFLDIIEPICERNDFLCGDDLTIADFWIGGLFTNFMANDNVGFAKDKWTATLAKFPAF